MGKAKAKRERDRTRAKELTAAEAEAIAKSVVDKALKARDVPKPDPAPDPVKPGAPDPDPAPLGAAAGQEAPPVDQGRNAIHDNGKKKRAGSGLYSGVDAVPGVDPAEAAERLTPPIVDTPSAASFVDKDKIKKLVEWGTGKAAIFLGDHWNLTAVELELYSEIISQQDLAFLKSISREALFWGMTAALFVPRIVITIKKHSAKPVKEAPPADPETPDAKPAPSVFDDVDVRDLIKGGE